MAKRGQNEQDRQANLHELADQFGEGVGNAEALINANASRRTQELAALSSLPVIQSATDELDLDQFEGPDGEYVVDGVVRGSGRTKGTIVVYEDGTGRLHKHLVESNYDEREQARVRRSSHAKERGEGSDPDAGGSAGGGSAADSGKGK